MRPTYFHFIGCIIITQNLFLYIFWCCWCYGNFQYKNKKFIWAVNCRAPLNGRQVGNEHWQVVILTYFLSLISFKCILCVISHQVIESYVEFLSQWKTKACRNSYNFISDSTSYGLTITSRVTLGLCKFLTKECDFKFIIRSIKSRCFKGWFLHVAPQIVFNTLDWSEMWHNYHAVHI